MLRPPARSHGSVPSTLLLGRSSRRAASSAVLCHGARLHLDASRMPPVRASLNPLRFPWMWSGPASRCPPCCLFVSLPRPPVPLVHEDRQVRPRTIDNSWTPSAVYIYCRPKTKATTSVPEQLPLRQVYNRRGAVNHYFHDVRDDLCTSTPHRLGPPRKHTSKSSVSVRSVRIRSTTLVRLLHGIDLLPSGISGPKVCLEGGDGVLD